MAGPSDEGHQLWSIQPGEVLQSNAQHVALESEKDLTLVCATKMQGWGGICY